MGKIINPNNLLWSYMSIVILGGFSSCSKTDFLNSKYKQSLVVPSSLTDMQKLIDNDQVFNGYNSNGIVPSLGEGAADDHFVSDAFIDIIPPLQKNNYLWEKNPYPASDVLDWNYPYTGVFYSNVILQGLDKIEATTSNQLQWNSLKGSALFHRGHMFYQLAQTFAPQYDEKTAAIELGIPLRMHADINESIKRASLQGTYDRVIEDLKAAIPLLPENVQYKTRPSKPATLGLLARVYQTMGNFDSALHYSNKALLINNTLLDYNSPDLNLDDWPCFKRFNDEVLFSCILVNTFILPNAYGKVDSVLFETYSANDLRKQAYFYPTTEGSYFKGTYDGTDYFFAGIANDEIYLIRSESYARKGMITEALLDLNSLLIKRWKTNKFIPITASSKEEALVIIYTERRKELLYRGLRWTDIRRLNKEPQYAKTLIRKVNGQEIKLEPGDLRFTWLIPDNVIGLNPQMKQNPR